MKKIDLNKINPRLFECYCLEYVKEKYKNKKAKIILTPKLHDGGKDIEIILIPSSIIHWGECKAHGRNLDLSAIGKNISLVIENDVKKIIFFSTSKIVYNTKKTIFSVAKKNKFDVVFLDKENLIYEFQKYKIIENENLSLSKDLNIKLYLEERSDYNDFFKTCMINTSKPFVLQKSGTFYVNLIVENRYTKNCRIEIKINENNKFSDMISFKKNYKIPSYTDTLIEIPLSFPLKYKETITLPDLSITLNGNTQNYSLGSITLENYPLIPLVGKNNHFILKCLKKDLLSQNIRLIHIKGENGIGKSRLISEAIKNVKHQIFKINSNKSLNFFINFLSEVIGIPLNLNEESKIKKDEFLDFLKIKKIDEKIGNAIFNFIFTPNKRSFLDEKNLFDYVVKLLTSPTQINYPIIFIFEQIESYELSLLNFLCNLVNHIQDFTANIKIFLETRNKSNNILFQQKYMLLINTLNGLNSGKDKKYVSSTYQIRHLSKQEINIYCKEILGLDNDSCAQLICDRALGNPQLLNSICFPLLQLSQNDRLLFLKKELDKNSVLQYQNFNLILCDLIKNDQIIEKFFKYIILFTDKMPKKFCRENFKDSDVRNLQEKRLIKYDFNYNCFSFYYSSYYEYLKKNIGSLKFEAQNLLNWLEKQKKFDYFLYFSLLIINEEFVKASDYGYDIINHKKINNSSYSCIIKFLLEQENIKSNKTKYFYVLKEWAHFNLFQENFKQGVKNFYQAFKISLNNNCLINNKEKYQIRHEYINSLIHSGKYNDALNILQSINVDEIKLPQYQFLVYNRLGVIYTFLYDYDEALKNLNKAQIIAEINKLPTFLSINYSDFGYLYMKFNNKNKAKIFFNNAVKQYKTAYKELYRDIEISAQSAISAALNNKLLKAQKQILLSINICKNNYRDYAWLKNNFIYAFIKIKMGKFEDAEKIYLDCIAKSKIFKNDIFLIESFAGLSALYMIQNINIDLINFYFEKIISYFIENRFEGLGFELSILKNFIFWFFLNGKENKILQILEMNIEQLHKFKSELEINKFKSAEQNAANYKGYNFLF